MRAAARALRAAVRGSARLASRRPAPRALVAAAGLTAATAVAAASEPVSAPAKGEGGQWQAEQGGEGEGGEEEQQGEVDDDDDDGGDNDDDDKVVTLLDTNRPPAASRLYVPPSSEQDMALFTCSGNVELSTEVAMMLGMSLGRSTVKSFADGEIAVRLHDDVRGKDVFVVQSTTWPPNANLMELLLFVSALRRASAGRVVAVVPYMSYMRQLTPSVPGSAATGSMGGADVAKMLEAVGCDHVITVDLHAGQAEGFFSSSVPVENVDPASIAVPYFLGQGIRDPVVVAPSASGVVRARNLVRIMREHGQDATLGLMFVRGDVDSDAEHHHLLGVADRMEIIGEVRGRHCIVVDDMVDSGTRMSAAADTLMDASAASITGFATHGLLTGNAVKLVNRSAIRELVLFNTLPLPLHKHSAKIRQLSVSALLAEIIRRVHTETSISELFEERRRRTVAERDAKK